MKTPAARLILTVVVPKAEAKAREIAALITPPLDTAVNDFFHSLTQFMGQTQDLASQVPIPGLAPWQSLSLRYMKAKGSSAFFLFSALQAYRHLMRGGRNAHEMLSGSSASLVSKLRGLSGSNTFGGVRLEIRDWRGIPLSTKPGMVPLPATLTTPIRFTLVIRPWGDLTTGDLPRIERWLQDKGVLSRQDVSKLTNPRGVQRPLIRPWLSFYSNTILPDVIRTALTGKYGKVTVRVARPFDPGPY